MNGSANPQGAQDNKHMEHNNTESERDRPSSAAPPKTVDRLLTTLRSADSAKNLGQCQGFAMFKQKVIREGKKSSVRHQLKVTALYDGSILPARMQQREGLHSVTANLAMQPPFEMIFGFFCSRQQGSLDGQGTFDEISKANVSMSFSELLKFASMMFPHHQFTRNELSWVMSRAKVEPIPQSAYKSERIESDLKALTYTEWLNCVLRLALIAYGPEGLDHDEMIDRVAKDFLLDNVVALKKRLDRIARTNAGFGAWKDENMRMEEGSMLSLSMKRPKPLQEYMPDRNKMTYLLDKLLRHGNTEKTVRWLPFDGPYISMMLPQSSCPYKFVIMIQNASGHPQDIGFKIHNLPCFEMQYRPSRGTQIASGLQCLFEIHAHLNQPGEFNGEVVFTSADETQRLAVCPVYLKVLHATSSASKVSHPPAAPPAAYESSSDSVGPQSSLTSSLTKAASSPPSHSLPREWLQPKSHGVPRDLFRPLTVKTHWQHGRGTRPVSSPPGGRSSPSYSLWKPTRKIQREEEARSEGVKLCLAI